MSSNTHIYKPFGVGLCSSCSLPNTVSIAVPKIGGSIYTMVHWKFPLNICLRSKWVNEYKNTPQRLYFIFIWAMGTDENMRKTV